MDRNVAKSPIKEQQSKFTSSCQPFISVLINPFILRCSCCTFCILCECIALSFCLSYLKLLGTVFVRMFCSIFLNSLITHVVVIIVMMLFFSQSEFLHLSVRVDTGRLLNYGNEDYVSYFK